MTKNELEYVYSLLRDVKKSLKQHQIPWAIFSGLAAYLYGSKRRITDIDILVRRQDLQKSKIILGLMKNVDIVAGLVIQTGEGECHFFMDDEMIENIQWKNFRGLIVPVVRVEDNIIFKALLQRQRNGKNDVVDIQNMIVKSNLDPEYLRKRIGIYRAEKRVYPLLESLGLDYKRPIKK